MAQTLLAIQAEVCMRAIWASVLFAAGCTSYVPGSADNLEGERNPPGYDPSCDLGTHCNPLPIASTPYAASGNTANSSERYADSYSCGPGIDEGGTEVWYAIDVSDVGRLTATVNEVNGDGIDVDVHILTDLDANACAARGDATATAQVQPGFAFIVVDTYTSSGGTEFPGAFELDVTFIPDGTGACAVDASDLRMRWSSCASGVDCYTSGGDTFLKLPAVGPVVKEAHLVTVEDPFSSWPNSFTDGIGAHYALSEAESGYSMSRNEPWAPAGEGGSEYGQAATAVPLPVIDEAWYITMNWKDRPTKGTRMIVRNPANGLAVVASAGWETGPGSNTAVAGVTEEIHHFLGTGHLSDLEVGFATDQNQPLGPVTCGGGSGPGTTPGTPPGTTPGSTTPGTTPGTTWGTSTACPSGMECTSTFPYTHSSTTSGGPSALDGYSCDPGVDESGPERVYQIEVTEPGFLAASLDGLPSGVDVDVHLLDANSASACVDRGHWDAGALVPPGTYYIVVDSWVDNSGNANDGAYTLTVGLTGYDDYTWAGLDPNVVETALVAFDTAWAEGDLDVLAYGIIDYSRPSTEERFWVIDLTDASLQFTQLTTHGSGSQDASDLRYSDTFSNTSGSHMSSIGLARAAETYYGSNGYSLKLDGLEPGWNSNDRSRYIVIHPASYATQDFVDDYGYLGRSQGCPAVDPGVSEDLIDFLKDGAGVFKYYPDANWLADSYFLQGLY